MGKWTLFWDMNSGGGQKEDFEKLYIEAPKDEACSIFYSRFGHSPHRVTCTCCGEDYYVSESDSLEEASGYHRGCRYDSYARKYVEEKDPNGYKPHISLAEYVGRGDVMVIRAEDIEDGERDRDIPDQGYVWVD